MKNIIVVGGGAAGMLAAIIAAKEGNKVTLFEKNERVGKKIFITGKGRCNVTNACDVEDLFQQVISNPKFLYSAFYSFDNQSVIQFFEEAGCKLKIERGDRVFPVSDHSSDIIKVLENEMKKQNVTIHLNTAVKELMIKENQIVGVKLPNNKEVIADSVIIATGGVSYPLTGSTGDGIKFAKESGHKIVDVKPALVPFNLKETFCKDLMGLALKNVTLTILVGNKEIYNQFGEMLFTHFGISGPLVLSGSSYLSKYKKSGDTIVKIDLKPALSLEQLDKRILREFDENKNKQFKNSLNGLFPMRLTPLMIELSGINPEKKVNEISKEERLRLVQLIKGWTLTFDSLRDFKEAIITQGGVSVKEVNPSTMESKMIKNLFFAGEVMDLDALTGGFNLQIAWSTGYLAGLNA